MSNPPNPLTSPTSLAQPAPPELDVLAVFAHPDDAELLCGGALAASVDQGERVGILDLTGGELGSRGTPELRAQEAIRAAAILGVHHREQAGFPDGRIEDTPEMRRQLAGILRRLRPRVVVTHWQASRHPDHRAASALVTSAAFLAGLRNLPCDGTPFRPHKVIYATSFREDAPRPSFVVDISATLERKLAALACYASQFEGVSGAGEVFPAGQTPLADQIRAHAAVDGSRIRCAAGEPFVTMETLTVPSLGALPVSTF
jgi:N-acetylglucosamine malate deacetylase 1